MYITKANAALFNKWQKLNSRLLLMQKHGIGKIPLQQYNALVRKWKHYLKQLLSSKHAIIKGLSAFGMAVCLASASNAQCNTFTLSDANNPLKRIQFTSSHIMPYFVDIDNDGDLDCYETYPDSLDRTQFQFLRNNGTKHLPYFEIDTATGFSAVGKLEFQGQSGPKFVDIDGDGDYDCFAMDYHSDLPHARIDFFENVGSKTSPRFVKSKNENPVSFIPGFYGLSFNFADVDQDGDYDLVFSDIYYSSFYKNVGSATNPVFEGQVGANNPFNGFYPNGNTTFYDWNKDGLIDCFNNWNPGTSYLRNIGTIGNPQFVLDNTGPSLPFGFPQWVDLNNDGFPEIFSFSTSMAATAPQATITATAGVSNTKLSAFPKGTGYTYRWKKNGKNIPGATTDSIFVSTHGLYTVSITSTCGTGVSLPYQFTSFTIAGTESNAAIAPAKIKVQLYPNPFTTECIINIPSSSKASIINVSDMQGRIVLSQTVLSGSIKLGQQLHTGVYIVQVIQGNVVVFTQKIIKQ